MPVDIASPSPASSATEGRGSRSERQPTWGGETHPVVPAARWTAAAPKMRLKDDSTDVEQWDPGLDDKSPSGHQGRVTYLLRGTLAKSA